MIARTVLYQASQIDFYRDVDEHIILHKMEDAALKEGLQPDEAEKRSWYNNAPKIKEVLEKSGVNDVYVSFEYLVPYTNKRIDCMLYGTDATGQGKVVHIELKQWSNSTVHLTDHAANFAVFDDDFSLDALTGGAMRCVAHPSQQVRGYSEYLNGFVKVFSEKDLTLYGVAYCYNYLHTPESPLFHKRFNTLLSEYPTYGKNDIQDLANLIYHELGQGNGFSVFNKLSKSSIGPSKKLLDTVGAMLEGDKSQSFSLLEDQIVAKNVIFDYIRDSSSDKKSIILVKGGPGTGKTVIALNILADLASRGINVRYSTKSASLIGGINYNLNNNRAARKLITSLTEFNYEKCAANSIDVLLIDEAHRVEKFYSGGLGKPKKTEMSQIDALLRATKVLVLFIDDRQGIRASEIGSTKLFEDCARRNGANLSVVELTSQFRCNGSNNYLDCLEQVLYNEPVTSTFTEQEYEVKIFDSPTFMYNTLLKKSKNPGTTARIMAGFCWPWSDLLSADGTPIADVHIGDFAMPWETHRNLRRPPAGYVAWYEWAYRPEGIKQVGCIYTAQGFEFDYAGVIIGPDLKYDEALDKIITDVSMSKDPMLTKKYAIQEADRFIRNIYRVLLSRGMKGTFIYCCDTALEKYLTKVLGCRH